jgi:hypothetical protein
MHNATHELTSSNSIRRTAAGTWFANIGFRTEEPQFKLLTRPKENLLLLITAPSRPPSVTESVVLPPATVGISTTASRNRPGCRLDPTKNLCS